MRLLLLSLVFVLALGGCTTLGPSVSHLGDARYPPTAYVERLRAEPVRPHVAIAEIAYRSSTHTRREIEDLIVEEARRIGADAIVFGKSSLAMLRSAGEPQRSEETYNFGGVAIRYSDR